MSLKSIPWSLNHVTSYLNPSRIRSREKKSYSCSCLWLISAKVRRKMLFAFSLALAIESAALSSPGNLGIH